MARAILTLNAGSSSMKFALFRADGALRLAMNGQMTVRSRFAIAAGDLALLSNEWTFEVGGGQISAVTSEVARRQPDGGWLYVFDHPYAGSEPEELAALMAAIGARAT